PGMRLVSHWTFSDVVWSPHGKQITSNHNKMWLLTLTEYELHRAAIGSLQGSVWATLRPLIGLYLMRPHLLRRHLQYSFDEVPDRMRRTGSATQGPDAPEQVLSALESDWRDRSFHQLRMGFGEPGAALPAENGVLRCPSRRLGRPSLASLCRLPQYNRLCQDFAKCEQRQR